MAAKMDINKVATRKSDINLDTGLYTGDIGLGGEYYTNSLYSDFVLVKYIDTNQGGEREEGGLLVPTLTNDLHWRKGEVLMVGPLVEYTEPGDLVVFPNDKGLVTATISYKNAEGNIEETNNAIFLDERRLFAKLRRKDEING